MMEISRNSMLKKRIHSGSQYDPDEEPDYREDQDENENEVAPEEEVPLKRKRKLLQRGRMITFISVQCELDPWP